MLEGEIRVYIPTLRVDTVGPRQRARAMKDTTMPPFHDERPTHSSGCRHIQRAIEALITCKMTPEYEADSGMNGLVDFLFTSDLTVLPT